VVHAPGFEKGHRSAIILRVREAYEAYGQMLHHYACSNLVEWMEADADRTYAAMSDALAGPRITSWVNLGGQLVPEADVDALRTEIGTGGVDSWDAIHDRYDELWAAYPLAKQRHAFAVYGLLVAGGGTGKAPGTPDVSVWRGFLERGIAIQELIRDRVFESRKKDHDNPFRRATYRNEEEMLAALGTVDENSFVIRVREETDAYRERVKALVAREQPSTGADGRGR
jgi:hypothetical protein